jgi:hypothetical protein
MQLVLFTAPRNALLKYDDVIGGDANHGQNIFCSKTLIPNKICSSKK